MSTKKTDGKLSAVQIRILQALRAGSMFSTEIAERFDSYSQPTTSLIKKHLIEKLPHGAFAITELGRQACPNRNTLLANVKAKKVAPEEVG